LSKSLKTGTLLLRHFLFSLCIATGISLPLAAFAEGSTEIVQQEPLFSVTLESGAFVSLDRALLDNLPQKTFTTSTPWTEGVISLSIRQLVDLQMRP